MSRQTGKPIWSKRNSGGPTDPAIAERALAYCAGRDVAARPPADAELVPYDIWTNRAHVKMLARQKIIDKATRDKIMKALARIERDWEAGKFTLDPALEDVHINIERRVAELAGESAAGVMHTARSRNDQSANDMRLWLRDRVWHVSEGLLSLIRALARLARREAETVAPGWTHGQPAMPTTLGHWALAHAKALHRDMEQLCFAVEEYAPLGAAASFGTSWPVDRQYCADLLGFMMPTDNSLDTISTRWENEARVAQNLAIMMTHLSSLGQDLIHMSSPPRSWLRLPDSHVTGSSIMPNKRNPDFCEVTRARAQSVHGLTASLTGVGRGLLSGYNRDTQWTKYWIMDVFWEVGEAPRVFADAIAGLKPDRRALKAAATEGFSLAADLADHLAQTRKLPFRKAYHVVAEAVAAGEGKDWIERETFNDLLKRERIKPLFEGDEWATISDVGAMLKKRNSEGGPEPEGVRSQAQALEKTCTIYHGEMRKGRRRAEAARQRASRNGG